ncbi:NAD(P)-binding protein, partial [Auriculariales sp. MPI-PUGE-AT-0066]
SQPTYTNFAVAGGAGGLGALITKALLSQGAEVIVLTRSKDSAVPAGAAAKVVDYADSASLSAALKGVQVVISALNAGGFGQQPALADAAKAAGVKLFVPSEYGNPTHEVSADSLLHFKAALHQHLRTIGLPYTLYYTGWFSDYNFIPPFGFDVANKTLTIVGKGNTPISFTSRPDVAHFIAYTLTHLPEDKLQNATLGVEGDRRTLVSLKQTFEEVFGGEFKLVHRDTDEVAKLVQEKREAVFLDYILLSGELGEVQIDNAQNSLVPGWQPLTVAAALKKYF